MTTTADLIDEATPKRSRGRPPGKYGSYKKKRREVSEAIKSGPELNLKDPFGLNHPPKPKRRRRHAEYDPEIGELICERLRTGQTLRSICMEPGMPDRATVIEWTYNHQDFAYRYARDLQTGIDALGEQARDESMAYVKAEDVPAARHRFDVLRWYVGKRAPKRWGDKVQAEISGPDGAPVTMQLDVMLQAVLTKPEVLARLSDVQLEALQSAIPLLVAPPQSTSARAEGAVDAEYSEVSAGDTKGD